MLGLRYLLLKICFCLSVSTLVAADRPNVVFILADDLGWGDVGCFGQEKIPTPNIDRLAREGMRLTQHYSGAPVCAPSRCVLITGKHLGHAEIRGNLQAKVNFPEFTEGQTPLSQGARTIANELEDAGYATAAFGKWGLGPVGSTGAPDRKGFQLFFGYNCQAVAHSYYPRFLWRNDQQIEINSKPIPGHKKKPQGDVVAGDYLGEQYAPYKMIDEAESFLRSVDQKPFFLYLPFIEPHVAMHPPQEAVDRFPREWDDRPYRGENGYLPHPRPRAAYAAMVSDLDRYVGRVLDCLEQTGNRERTLVIFTSDNGATHGGNGDPTKHVGGADMEFFQSVRHLRGYKGSVHEGGIRVPTIVRWPGVVAAGGVSHSASYFADWYPTLCDVVGLPKPAGLDGESLRPMLTGEVGKDWKRSGPMVWVFPEYGGQVAIREGDWKLVRKGLATKQPGPWELYQMSDDPSETTNLAPQHPTIVRDLQSNLHSATSENPLFPSLREREDTRK